jgi:two-component system sensor histidine kinase KdpD
VQRPPAERALALAAVFAVVAGTTLAGRLAGANATTAGFLFLLAVLFLTLRRGLFAGVAASIASTLAFNYFFLPPLHTLTIAEPANWAALAAFGITTVVTGRLVAAERHRAEEAEAKRRDTQTLYDLCFGLFTATNRPGRLDEAAAHTLSALGALRGGLVLVEQGRARCVWATGEAEAIAEEPGVERAIAGEQVVELEPAGGARRLAAPLAVGGRLSGALVVTGGRTDPEILASAGRLLALAIERDHLIEQSTRSEALAASDRLKTALLRAVSHDLRSPLTAMAIGLEALLRDTPESSPDRIRLLVVARERERLGRRVDQLLTAARLEAGLLHPHLEPIPAAELFRAARENLELVLADHTVEVAIARDCPELAVDAALVVEALVNLIENAARVSPAQVEIRLSAFTDPDARGTSSVVLEVADRGPGLPAALAEQFAGPSDERRATTALPLPGLPEGGRGGLGLAIVRQLAAACGGSFELRDRPGGGAAARLTLPAFHPDAAQVEGTGE